MSEYLKSLISDMPGLIYIKDFNHNYHYVNQAWLALTGYNAVNDVIGLSDDDVIAYALTIPDGFNISHYRESFVAEDVRAYRGDNFHVLDVHYYKNEAHFLLGYRQPHYDESNRIVGAFGQSMELFRPSWASVFELLSNPSIQVSEFSKINIEKFFEIKLSEYRLSSLERFYVHAIAQGMTAKQVAAIQHRSVRTIEAHLDNAKQKLGCRNRVELVAKAISEGLIAYHDSNAIMC